MGVKMMSFVMIVSSTIADDYKSSQLKHARVKEAYEKKGVEVMQLLEDKKLVASTLDLYMRAFKKEGELEIWGKNQQDEQYRLIKIYRICYASGNLGPKRRQGDNQVPEGFYHIDRFNPNSSFYLSLGINYPNASDKILGNQNNLGGDIFIHGNCVSIGCLAMTDDVIKEIYILAVEARNSGQNRISVTLFPFRMGDVQYNEIGNGYQSEGDIIRLWSDLKTAYDYFEKSKTLPGIVFHANGRHGVIITN
jgi:murein L,D-transpeptidase YafK